MRTLKVTSGPEEGRTLEIEGELIIGREGADLVLPDSELSRRHVVLREVEQGIEVEDLGSLNGTFVNGERIGSPVTLTLSGSLKLGTTEMAVEVALPEARQVPDVTVPRAVPPEGLEVTRQRPIPEPDVTAVRPVAPDAPQAGQPPPEAAPPAGPPGGLPPLPAPMRVLLPRLAKYAAGRWLLQRVFRLPASARVPVLLLVLLAVIALPVAAVVLLLL